MKNKELASKITEVLTSTARLTSQEIAYQVNGTPTMIQIHGVLNTMKNMGAIEVVVSDKIRYYSLIANNKENVSKSSRNLSKFNFNGINNLNKGRLAHAIVTKFVIDNNPTYKELKEVFPDEIVKPYGVIQSEETTHVNSPDPKRKRYFLNDEDAIILNKGKVKKIYVTNQWTVERISKLLLVAEGKLSYEIWSVD